MNLRKAAVAGALLAAFAAGLDLPRDDEVRPDLVLKTGDYTEGVVVDHDGNLYFSREKIITRMKQDGTEATAWAETGAPNGHKILADGTHLVCDASRHAVLHLGHDGRVIKNASDSSDGKPLRGPNDLTLDTSNGGFYFTDPGGSDENNRIGTIHYVDRAGKTTTVATGLAFPNGIALRPDGSELLVAESKRNRILLYPVESPGKLGEQKVFVNLPAKGPEQTDNQPDGICLDAAGNLYVAHYGMRQIQVIDPQGRIIRRYPGGNLTTSNVCFAGPNMTRLFATGGEPGGVFKLDLQGTKGLVILPKRVP
jgi:gluconolactonase